MLRAHLMSQHCLNACCTINTRRKYFRGYHIDLMLVCIHDALFDNCMSSARRILALANREYAYHGRTIRGKLMLGEVQNLSVNLDDDIRLVVGKPSFEAELNDIVAVLILHSVRETCFDQHRIELTAGNGDLTNLTRSSSAPRV